MAGKSSILLLLILLLFATGAYTQGTAEATMRVSVRITSGITTTVDTHSDLQFGENGIRGEIGSVSLSGIDHDQMLITNDANLNLVNEKGQELVLPVNVRNHSNPNENKLTLLYLSADQKTRAKYKGKYIGTLSTTIEYL